MFTNVYKWNTVKYWYKKLKSVTSIEKTNGLFTVPDDISRALLLTAKCLAHLLLFTRSWISLIPNYFIWVIVFIFVRSCFWVWLVVSFRSLNKKFRYKQISDSKSLLMLKVHFAKSSPHSHRLNGAKHLWGILLHISQTTQFTHTPRALLEWSGANNHWGVLISTGGYL